MDRGAAGLFTHDLITSIARTKSKSRPQSLCMKRFNERGLATGQILLAWALARGLAVIPKSTEYERLVENLEAANVRLTEEEVKRISDLNLDLRVGLSMFVWCKAINGFLGSQLNDPVDIDPRLGIWA